MKIPERHHNGVRLLLGLTEEQVSDFLSALANVPLSLNREQLASRIAGDLPSIPAPDITSMLPPLLALCSLRAFGVKALPDFLEDVARAVDEARLADPKLTDEGRTHFKERLRKFLELTSLNVASKALDLLNQYEHVLCSVRILTDVRPVFGLTSGEAPKAAVIAHSLKLVYHAGDDLKEFFVALDRQDLKALRDQLDRAEAKASSLRAVLAQGNVSYLDAE